MMVKLDTRAKRSCCSVVIKKTYRHAGALGAENVTCIIKMLVEPVLSNF